jgi:hypothetical protein
MSLVIAPLIAYGSPCGVASLLTMMHGGNHYICTHVPRDHTTVLKLLGESAMWASKFPIRRIGVGYDAENLFHKKL